MKERSKREVEDDRVARVRKRLATLQERLAILRKREADLENLLEGIKNKQERERANRGKKPR